MMVTTFPRKLFLFVLLLIIFLASTSSARQDTLRIKIVETSDVHGAIFPFDFRNKRRAPNSLANVITYLNQEKVKTGQEVVLLDNGDILQGQPLVYYYNVEKDLSPNICSEVMNYMNYDAATIGNHDIETGHEVYDKVKKEFNFPWLAANAIDTKTNMPYFQPYTVIKRKGLKIAILGLITPYIPHWLPEKLWKGIRFEDMILTAKKWVPIILDKEKPDIMVGLFHSGVEYDYNNQSADEPCNENASQLVAEKVPGFDIIFVGHDHIGWNKTVKNSDGKNVLILGTQSDSKNIAVANIDFVKDKKGVRHLNKISGELIETSSYPIDKNFLSKFIGVVREVNQYTSRTVTTFSDSISTRESMFGNSAFVDLIHTIQLYYTKADISFTAPLSFDAKIRKGPVYISDMFNFYKYENFLYTMSLTGKEIKGYLEFSFENWFNQMSGPDDHLLLFKKDQQGNIINTNNGNSFQLKGQYYNFCSAAGINYIVDVSKPAGEKVTISSMSNGAPFEMDKTYKVALNSYRGNGGGGHLVEGAKIPQDELKNRIISSSTRDLRYYMIFWMKKNNTIIPKTLENWKIIPEEWWKIAKEKDYYLLYGIKK